jgi:hypothetical protein
MSTTFSKESKQFINDYFYLSRPLDQEITYSVHRSTGQYVEEVLHTYVSSSRDNFNTHVSTAPFKT